jgi:hypothetical protein
MPDRRRLWSLRRMFEMRMYCSSGGCIVLREDVLFFGRMYCSAGGCIGLREDVLFFGRMYYYCSAGGCVVVQEDIGAGQRYWELNSPRKIILSAKQN